MSLVDGFPLAGRDGLPTGPNRMAGWPGGGGDSAALSRLTDRLSSHHPDKPQHVSGMDGEAAAVLYFGSASAGPHPVRLYTYCYVTIHRHVATSQLEVRPSASPQRRD